MGQATFSLRKFPLFSGLSPEDAEAFQRQCVPVSYRAGVRIFDEGEPARGFYLVLSGQVKIFKLSPRGQEHILAVIGPGGTFAEAAAFLGRGYPASTECLEDSELVFVEREPIRQLLVKDPDMALRMMDLANGMGIGKRVLFTGFLRGGDVDKVFRMADCYVMPSVSEPFGIAALEAISHDVPVIISKTSGASEVLRHALKVDFWDTDEMAAKIVAVLSYPALADTLREHGAMELRQLTWEGAAERCLVAYQSAMP